MDNVKHSARNGRLSRRTCDFIVSTVKRLCGECTVYLFGSYAAGTATAASDIDIAVVMDRVESKIAVAAELWKALSDIPYPKDIVVASREEFEFYRNEPGSVYRTIADKGTVLYGSSTATSV